MGILTKNLIGGILPQDLPVKIQSNFNPLQLQLWRFSVTTESSFYEQLKEINALIQENAKLKRLLEEASTDFLTGLPGRRQFERRVEEELSHIRRYHTTHHFAVFVMDLDNLKKVNDTHGHSAGDKMIAEFGVFLKRLVRDYDMVARLGGDEFMVFLPQETKESAIATRERILAELETHRSSLLYFSGVSIGVASTSDGLTTFKELYDEADKDMYSHKKTSRGVLLKKYA